MLLWLGPGELNVEINNDDQDTKPPDLESARGRHARLHVGTQQHKSREKW